MIRIGCNIPGGSFMPQGDHTVENSYAILQAGSEIILSGGFDYVEASVGCLMELTEAELQRAVENGLVVEACNCFIPARFSIMKASDGLEEYVAEAMRRMHMLSCDTVVLGSGGARMIPENMPPEAAEEAFMRFLHICNRYGEKEKITVVLEPLNRQECNYMNQVSEGYAAVCRAALPRIRLLADAYHMGLEEEPFSVLSEVGDTLHHIHIAENRVRTYPGSVEKSDFLPSFAKALLASGYAGRVTAECSFTDFPKQAADAARYMRAHFCKE